MDSFLFKESVVRVDNIIIWVLICTNCLKCPATTSYVQFHSIRCVRMYDAF